ncbi:NAD(P)H-dependent oxidoreductase [Rapidithrix thailandica]|uniref:NAD(P)H-dependent oxidoreductase n=1 Tax=Rapidithrix thailandica TaxID=413964 RepID=A0AAW9S993_9BACT
MTNLIESLQWRYATKKFDASKKVAQQDIDELINVLQLSASSYGLQPYKFLVISNPELKKKLQPVTWNQAQTVDASHLVVFCSYTQLSGEDIDAFIQRISEARNIPLDTVQGYGDFIKGKVSEKSAQAITDWNARQAYIAIGKLLTVCAQKGIDTCPMEGFEPQQYDQLLGLSEKGLQAVALVAIGYRSEEDATQHLTKVRKPVEELVEIYN